MTLIQPLRIGDQVQLKSGGPIMTVLAVHPTQPDRFIIIWTDNDGRLNEAGLPPEVLRKINQPH